MRSVDLVDVDIHGEIQNLTINGVDVGPLVEAELDRRYPLRSKMRPTDPAGFREAWDILERLWGETVAAGPRWNPTCCTSRSTASGRSSRRCATWCSRRTPGSGGAILGDPSPWDPLDLPWDEMPDTPGVPAGPRRHGRRSTTCWSCAGAGWRRVRQVIEGLTVAVLDGDTEPVEGPGWPPAAQLPGAQVPARHPQRGVGAPPVRRAGPGMPYEPAGRSGAALQALLPAGSTGPALK